MDGRQSIFFAGNLLNVLQTSCFCIVCCLQVFALHVTGSLDSVLSTEHRHEICRYLYNHQACIITRFLLFSSNSSILST